MEKPSIRVQRRLLRKLVIIAACGLVALLFYYFFGDSLSFDFVRQHEVWLRAEFAESPWRFGILACLLYVVVTGLSLPGAVPLSLVCAWIMGFWGALGVVSFGSTAGASVAFLLARYLFRDWIQVRFRTQMVAVNQAIHSEGALYLFSLRLLPLMPHVLINALMGLTRLRLRTFWWVSQLGMLPGTMAFLYVGANLPSLDTLEQKGLASLVDWKIIFALTMLATMPLALRRLVKKWKSQGEPHR